ncbi:MAG: tRNA pseudouridine32 synthase/23S rRNA pseudouridine746 synthase [Motiliproteus sp.]|jgi:tRNA pseudouridine32 synthase/23S rRNA pseudouridine746 synthase
MAINPYPSKLSLPQVNPGFATVLEYLIAKFPAISAQVWQQRAADGKVHWHDGSLITAASPYRPQQRVYYYREVEAEPLIPLKETILFQDELLLVAYKPPFLPVTPGGRYVNECLQNRLRETTGIATLQALHRIDRATSGLVLFSVDPATSHRYHQLFETRQMDKTYQAIARINTRDHTQDNTQDHAEELPHPPEIGRDIEVLNRLEASEPRFLMQVTEGKPNSHSLIRCLQLSGDNALFELKPISGKTHQLRVHMQSLGWPILHDRYYPRLQPEAADTYAQPLQLLARELRFIDPVTQRPRAFSCDRELSLAI